MANKVYDTVELSLQDSTDVEITQLPIGRLRRFLAAWNQINDLDDGDDGFDVFINCCGVALENNFKGKFDALKANAADQEAGEFLSPEYKAYLEEVLDLETIYKILDVAGGIDLKNPKLLEAAQEQLGKTST